MIVMLLLNAPTSIMIFLNSQMKEQLELSMIKVNHHKLEVVD